MKNGKVGFGIIGIGNMGRSHSVLVQNLSNAEVVAACDINPKAFEQLAPEQRGRIPYYDSAEKLFDDANVDAVIVSVPHYAHPDLAIGAMEHGKHVVVEKPIAVHKKEAIRLIEAAKKHPNLVKSAMFNQRTLPMHRKLKSLIDLGEFGRINRICWTITDWFRPDIYYASGQWRATWAGEGGGVLLNQCPHQLDLLQWFFGMPKRVSAFAKIGKFHDIEVEDEVNAYMEFPNGAVGNFITTTGEAPGVNRLEIAAERGLVTMEGGRIHFRRNEIETAEWCRTTKITFGLPPIWECEIPYSEENRAGHQIILENVANVILGKEEKLFAPLEEGINGLELGNAMLLSGLKGKVVDFPLDADEYAETLSGLAATSRYKDKKAVDVATSGFESSFGTK